MRYHRKQPCRECPFRAECIPGYLGPQTGRPADFINPIAGRVEISPGVFIGGEPLDVACHMDIDRALRASPDKDVEQLDADQLQHCAGALLFLVRDCKLPHDREKVDAMERVEALNKNTKVLGNVREFMAHHTRKLRGSKRSTDRCA
jgi:hypothetical protein